MKIRRNRKRTEDDEPSYWLSYSDMMAGLLLVFVLIISFTILQAKAQYEAKEEELAAQALIIFAQQEDLTSKESQLDEQQSQLDEQQEQLDEQQSQLDEQQSQLDEQQALLDAQQTLLSDQETELEEQKSAVEALQELLALKQAELEEKEELVGTQQEELAAQQEELDRIIGIKSDLIQALKAEFENTNLKVSVDSRTGAITLDSSVLFDIEEYYLTEAGEELLKEFIPIYIGVLLSPEFSGYVSEIIIEGHTDTDGTYMHNLQLSQQRALSVAYYCLSTDSGVLTPQEIAALRTMLTANGKSYSDPVYDANGNVDMDASRRVEFKFRLNDEDMIQEMIDILNEDDEEN